MPRTPEAAFVKKYLAPLKGATIESVGADEQDDYGTTEAWPVLNVRLATGERLKLEISRDPEGNGPGFIFGLPHPEESA